MLAIDPMDLARLVGWAVLHRSKPGWIPDTVPVHTHALIDTGAAVAAELGRDVQDCVSRSTLLHLQELERSSRPVPLTQQAQPRPAPSGEARASASLSHQAPSFGADEERGAPPAVQPPLAARGRSSPLDGSGSGSSKGGKAPLVGLLASEVAALARRHQFDWAAVGACVCIS